MASEYNNLSPKLLDELPKLKPNERLRFQLLGVYHDVKLGRLVCPQSHYLVVTDRIWDPYAHESKDENGKVVYEGDYKDIAFIERENPAPRDSQRDKVTQFGEIGFLRAKGGIVEIIGGNKAHEKMLIFLFFANKNKSNEGKSWHIKPEGKYVFQLLDPSNKASKSLEQDKLRDQAKMMVSKKTEEERLEMAKGLMPSLYYRLTPNEIEQGLRELASKNPQKILTLDDNIDVKMTAFIENAIKYEIIAFNREKSQWQWVDDEQQICFHKMGEPHATLKKFFFSENGSDALKAIENLLEKVMKPKKQGASQSKAKTEKVTA